MAFEIDDLQIKIQSSSSKASTDIDALSSSLTRLKGAAKGGAGLTSTINQLNKLQTSLAGMTMPGQKINALVAALNPLQSIGKSNLGSALNQLKKIPEITKGLDSKKLSEFATKITQITKVMKPLATEMQKVSTGFSKLPANIQKAINANARLTKSNYTASNSFFKLGNIMAKVYILRRISRIIGDWVTESNSYVENLNLFRIAMGKYYSEAKLYAEKVGEILGIDPNQFMRYQAVFMNMAKGFGIAADKAALMSQNLTQLGYDFASVFNVKFDIAMEKLESALSGQPRPMREWGFDLSESTLKDIAKTAAEVYQGFDDALSDASIQQLALNKGILESVENMGQAEKSQLRYIQLMTTAQKLGLTGDFARTLSSSANQLRILQSMATQAGRALGNIFIPALNKVLPYAIAFLKVVRLVATSIAELFGFELPEFDYAGLTTGIDDTSDSLDDATDSATALKNALAGFDELHIISPSTGAGSDAGDVGGGSLDLDLPSYDFIGDAVDSKVAEIFDTMTEKFLALKEVFSGFGETVSEFFDDQVGPGLVWFYDNAIVPMWEWSKDELIPAALGLLSSALEFLGTIIDAAKPSLLWIWNTFFVPIRDFSWKITIAFLNSLKNSFEKLTDWASSNKTTVENMATAIIGFLAGMWLYKTTKNIILWMDGLRLAFLGLAGGITMAGMASLFANIGFGLLAAGVLLIAMNWSKMNDMQKTVAILGAVAIAAAAAAAAVGALQSAWSLGIAAVAIIGGITAIALSVKSASKNATAELSSMETPNIPAPTFEIPNLYASGGLPSTGELFMARESGPEMVGSMGGKTAVANNDQIVSAVSQGVAEAVARVLSSQGDSQGGDIKLYIDGKQITTVVEKQQRKAGYSVMKNPAFAGV